MYVTEAESEHVWLLRHLSINACLNKHTKNPIHCATDLVELPICNIRVDSESDESDHEARASQLLGGIRAVN